MPNTSGDAPVISADRLSFSYPTAERPALLDLTFSINKREVIAILGANGSGKSTLAKLLAGLIHPSSGNIRIFGEDLTQPAGLNTIMGKIGIVFQSPDEQMVATTVEREIAFGLENQGVPTRELRQRVDDIMAQFKLTAFAEKSPHCLSGGEKQKVALASVLVMQPKILILDEVTSLLDPLGRLEVHQMIDQLRHQLTLVQITQFPEETLTADRIILLEAGQMVDFASPATSFSLGGSPKRDHMDTPLVIRLYEALKCEHNAQESR
jgi:energy-coupling factor transport system ATP-binding protein